MVQEHSLYIYTLAIFLIWFKWEIFICFTLTHIHTETSGITKGARSEKKIKLSRIENLFLFIWYAIYRTATAADTHSINILIEIDTQKQVITFFFCCSLA